MLSLGAKIKCCSCGLGSREARFSDVPGSTVSGDAGTCLEGLGWWVRRKKTQQRRREIGNQGGTGSRGMSLGQRAQRECGSVCMIQGVNDLSGEVFLLPY
jgi:hypothetical protein